MRSFQAPPPHSASRTPDVTVYIVFSRDGERRPPADSAIAASSWRTRYIPRRRGKSPREQMPTLKSPTPRGGVTFSDAFRREPRGAKGRAR